MPGSNGFSLKRPSMSVSVPGPLPLGQVVTLAKATPSRVLESTTRPWISPKFWSVVGANGIAPRSALSRMFFRIFDRFDHKMQRRCGMHKRIEVRYNSSATTSLTPGTSCFSKFSMPCFNVTMLLGQPLHDPRKLTVTIPSSKERNAIWPPSPSTAGRIYSSRMLMIFSSVHHALNRYYPALVEYRSSHLALIIRQILAVFAEASHF